MGNVVSGAWFRHLAREQNPIKCGFFHTCRREWEHPPRDSV